LTTDYFFPVAQTLYLYRHGSPPAKHVWLAACLEDLTASRGLATDVDSPRAYVRPPRAGYFYLAVLLDEAARHVSKRGAIYKLQCAYNRRELPDCIVSGRHRRLSRRRLLSEVGPVFCSGARRRGLLVLPAVAAHRTIVTLLESILRTCQSERFPVRAICFDKSSDENCWFPRGQSGFADRDSRTCRSQWLWALSIKEGFLRATAGRILEQCCRSPNFIWDDRG